MKEEYKILETIAILLRKGYPIQDMLEICRYVSKSKILNQIEENLQQGESLRNSILKADISKSCQEFFYFFSLQKEISEAIVDSVSICKKQNDTFRQLKKKLVYPLCLLIFLFFFSLFVTLFLLPQVQQLFMEFSIQLPFFFSVVFFILRYIPLIFMGAFLGGIGVGSVCFYAVKKQRYVYLDFLITKKTCISYYIKKYYSLKFAVYYHELLNTGYDTTRIISILAEQTIDADIKMLVYEIRQEVLQGKEMVQIVKEFEYFEPMLATYFVLLLKDDSKKTALKEYIAMNLMLLDNQIQKGIRIVIPSIYSFVIVFVVVVYVGIILPMMDIVNSM